MNSINKFSLRLVGALLVGIACFSACKDSDEATPMPKPDLVFFALVDGKQLAKINANNSEIATATIPLMGLQTNESLVSVDFRPATGELYGVSSQNRLYAINQESGLARQIGSATLSPTIDGTAVGLDFNPTVDRIRLVTNTGQNLRLHPETGAVAATDGAINGGSAPSIEAVAYTNNVAGATTTVLYDLDAKSDKLYKQDPPNNGTLVEVGALGTDVSMVAGFDIAPITDIALAAVMVSGKWELQQVDLTTGKITKLGNLPAGTITGLAIPSAPVAYALDESNNLLIFNPLTIGTPVSKTITGLQSGETILGIDMRPANGQLIGLGSSSRLYAINMSSGVATAIGTAPFATLLDGTTFGFDFNPTVDRIRCISNTGQNLRLHPDLGTIAAVDAKLNPSTPAVTAAAYTNNFSGATATVLYDIDTTTDKLYKQDPPNNGTLVEVGMLGINTEAANGFDITSRSGVAYAILKISDKSALYSINLSTGVSTKVVDFPIAIRGLTLGIGF